MLSTDLSIPMTSTPVIFIHGFADISHRWRLLGLFLKSRGIQIHFFDYPTLSNKPDVPGLAGVLAAFIHDRVPDGPFQIMAHSQGGLIAEWYDLFSPNPRLEKIVTLGTPFHGSILPAIPPRFLIDHSPAGREQLKGLGTFSPLIQNLIRGRLRMKSETSYVNFIGHSKRILGLDSDLVVLAVEANRNAHYFAERDGTSTALPSTATATTIVTKKNHWPHNLVRDLDREDNEFAVTLVRVAKNEPINLPSLDRSSQAALVYPADRQDHFENVDADLIMERKTASKNFRIRLFELGRADSVHVKESGVRLSRGSVTYVLDDEPRAS